MQVFLLYLSVPLEKLEQNKQNARFIAKKSPVLEA